MILILIIIVVRKFVCVVVCFECEEWYVREHTTQFKYLSYIELCGMFSGNVELSYIELCNNVLSSLKKRPVPGRFRDTCFLLSFSSFAKGEINVKLFREIEDI